jgi:hypothetical protein
MVKPEAVLEYMVKLSVRAYPETVFIPSRKSNPNFEEWSLSLIVTQQDLQVAGLEEAARLVARRIVMGIKQAGFPVGGTE